MAILSCRICCPNFTVFYTCRWTHLYIPKVSFCFVKKDNKFSILLLLYQYIRNGILFRATVPFNSNYIENNWLWHRNNRYLMYDGSEGRRYVCYIVRSHLHVHVPRYTNPTKLKMSLSLLGIQTHTHTRGDERNWLSVVCRKIQAIGY